jgi:hypothetical protein
MSYSLHDCFQVNLSLGEHADVRVAEYMQSCILLNGCLFQNSFHSLNYIFLYVRIPIGSAEDEMFVMEIIDLVSMGHSELGLFFYVSLY